MNQTHVDGGDDAPFPQRRVFRELELCGDDPEDPLHVQPLTEQIPPGVLEQRGNREMKSRFKTENRDPFLSSAFYILKLVSFTPPDYDQERWIQSEED